MFNCKSLLLLLLITCYLNNILSQGDNKSSKIDSLSQLLLELNGISKFHQYLECIAFAEKARALDMQDFDPLAHITIFQYIAFANKGLGENDKAQQFLFKGLRVADSLKLDVKIAEISNSIGLVYYSMEDFARAEKYCLIAIEKAKEIGNEANYSIGFENLAVMYTRLEKYEDAERIILGVIDTLKSKGEISKSKLGLNYNNLSVVYHGQKKYEEAIVYIKKSLAIAQEMNDTFDIAMRHCNLGELYGEVNNYKLAKRHFDIGLGIAKGIENKEVYNNGLLQAAEMFEKFGKYEKALSYYEKFTLIKDSLLNEKRIQIVAEAEEKFEATKKELEISSLSRENIKSQNELKFLRYLIVGLSFGLMGFLGFIYFIRQNHKKNVIIQDKNLKIASDKIEILEKNKEITKLSSLIKGQEYERERLAKEMHDGLGGLLAISHSKLANLSEKKEVNIDTIEESKNLVGEAYNQVRQISHNLMPLDLEKFGLVTTLENMIGLVNNQNDDINIDFITYNFEAPLNNELGLNMYRIVQEALTNILKYAQAKNVLIELIQHEHNISLSIEDDGIGFDVKNFKSGIGIQNMRNRSEIVGGSFEIESKFDVGTSISVQIPMPVPLITQDQI